LSLIRNFYAQLPVIEDIFNYKYIYLILL